MDETTSTDYDVSADALKRLAEALTARLAIRTLPIGLKLFEDVDEMMAVPGIRTPTAGFRFTACQIVTQSRMAGFTLGIVHDNVRANSNCGGVLGLNVPDESTLSGEQMDGVWFAGREAAKAHQDTMVRVPTGRAQRLGGWMYSTVTPSSSRV